MQQMLQSHTHQNGVPASAQHNICKGLINPGNPLLLPEENEQLLLLTATSRLLMQQPCLLMSLAAAAATVALHTMQAAGLQ
jgi:hypothetical protein